MSWSFLVPCVEKRVEHVVRILFVFLSCTSSAMAQSARPSPDHPWHSAGEPQIEADTKTIRESRLRLDPAKTYTLAELIDLAETHNPETHFAWERARAQAAALGIARSELYPTLTTAAVSQTDRREILSGNRFYRQTIQEFY